MYTSQLFAPPEMQVYAYGEDAGGIHIEDFAHLTMINVTVIPYAYISVCDHAVVTIINCTNHYNMWCSHGSATNVVSVQPEGNVAAQEHATVLIEGSTIGFLTVDYGSYVNCTVVDSFVDRALLNTRLPSRFVDCEVYELHDPIGNVDLVGATTVAYRGHPWTGARMAIQLSATLEKTDFLRGEPIAMTCHLRNVGGLNVTLFLSDGTDRFYLCACQLPVSEDTTFQYFNREPKPGPHTPTVVLPGETLAYTLIWENPPFLAGTYELEGGLESPTLYDALHACGFYTITISEDKWQG